MIQHTARVLCAFIVLTISVFAQKQPNFAPEAYKKLARLEGDWVGKDDQGAEVKSNFKLAISNTVVMETLNASGMEEMLTLYSVDGDGRRSGRSCAEGSVATGEYARFWWCGSTARCTVAAASQHFDCGACLSLCGLRV